jgi:competence protein ComEC
MPVHTPYIPFRRAIWLRPIVPLLLVYMAGITLGVQAPGYTIAVGIIALLGAGLWLSRWCRVRWGTGLGLGLVLMVGYVAIQPWVVPWLPDRHVIHFAGEQRYTIHGRVSRVSQGSIGRQRLVLDVLRLETAGEPLHVTGKAKVTLIGEGPGLQVGEQIAFRGRLRRLRNFNNPGGFDYERYMAFKGIRVSSYARADQVQRYRRQGGSHLVRRLAEIRPNLIALVRATGPTGDRYDTARDILQALLLGERSRISAETRDRFNRAGVAHVLAISGLHVGIIAGMAFWVLRWLGTFCHPLLMRGWTSKAAALITLVPVWLYGWLAGMSPSTQRAVIMATVFLLAMVADREHDTLNALALAGAVILGLHPPSLYAVSFQLSFAAALVIVLGLSRFPLYQQRPQRRLAWVAHKGLLLLLVSALATIGTLPLVMHYFNQISLVGLLANLIIIPLIGFATVPLGLASLLLGVLHPMLASWGVTICLVLLQPALGAIQFWAGLPWAAIKTFTPSVLEMVCVYVLLATLLVRGQTSPWWPVTLRRAGVVVAVAVLLIDGIYWINERFWRDDLRITVLDVGQGSAAVAELPNGATVVIDGGGFSSNAAFDVGERILAPFLWQRKIMSVDTLILSHANSDHMNGLIYLAAHFDPQELWTNGEGAPTAGYRQLMSTAERQGIVQPAFEQLPREHHYAHARLKILYPSPGFLALRNKEHWLNRNNNSIVVRIDCGRISFLFPGDTMARAERYLIARHGAQLKSSVLVAGHHGSSTSSSQGFLDRVQPDIIIFSSGYGNRFGFPHTAVLERCAAVSKQVYRTDRHGAIRLVTDGQSLNIYPTLVWVGKRLAKAGRHQATVGGSG